MTATVKAWDLEPGRYLCFHTPGLFARLIRWSTRSQYNHVAIVVPGGQVVQATLRGVKTTPLSAFTGYLAVTNAGEAMTAHQLDLVATKALSMSGDEYGYAGIGALALADLGWHWQVLFKLVGLDGDAFFCSQLAAACGVYAGLSGWLCGQQAPDEVTPAMLAARPCTVPVSWAP